MSKEAQQPSVEAPLFSDDRTFNAQNHDWFQHGRELICTTCPGIHRHGTLIPSGKMLIGIRGKWEIVDEGPVKRQQ